MVLGQVSSSNAWMDPVQDDVTNISDALLTAQCINEDSVTWCLVGLGQFDKRLGSIQDDVNDISNALVADHSTKQRLCYMVLGQVSLPNIWILFTMTSQTLAMRW